MIVFNEADWQRIRQDYMAFWHGQLDRPLVVAYGAKNPLKEWGTFCTPYTPDMPVESIICLAQQVLENTICFGDAFPVFWPNFGPGLVSAMSGLCDLHYSAGTVWYEPKQIQSLEQLTVQADLCNLWFVKIQELIELAVRTFRSTAQVAFPDLGGNLDLLSACRTPSNLLIDLVDNPHDVKRVLWEFHQAWWIYFDKLKEIIQKQNLGFVPWALTWADSATYILQCDFAAMISPEMFAEFVMPEIQKSCRMLKYAFFHLDGPGMIPHVEHLLSIPELGGIQWQPGAGAPSGDTWTDLVKRILDAGKRVQLITNRQQTINAIRHFGRQNIMFLMLEPLTVEQADEFFKTVQVDPNYRQINTFYS